MKILIIHTYYTQNGGEDVVFEQEVALLKEEAVVEKFVFHNQLGIKGAIQFFFSICNISVAKKLKQVIDSFKPDVIHIHNTHFAIGPIAIRVAKKAGIPIVMTLHNYRLLCPSATFMAKGTLFLGSLKTKFPWQAIKKKVYRNSTIQTFWLAFIIWIHKIFATWKFVDQYIVLTDFARELFIESTFGVSDNKFIVKPNFVNQCSFNKHVITNNAFLFVGRLSEEKGVLILLKAFKSTNHVLRIAGDGPLKSEVEKICSQYKNIIYLGKLDKEFVLKELNECTALVFPSIWYEGMPMTLLESLSIGKSVIASNFGAMASVIQNGNNGILFEVGNVEKLKEKLNEWQQLTEEQKKVYNSNALNTYKKNFSPHSNRDTLFTIYEKLIKFN